MAGEGPGAENASMFAMIAEVAAHRRGDGGPAETSKVALGLCLAGALLLAGPAVSKEEEATEERLSTVERAIEVLAAEQDRLRTALAVPEDESLRSVHGLGPAASKIYLKEKGLSIGGYAELMYRNFVADRSPGNADLDSADAERFVLYLGNKFNSWLLFNSEIEFEHGTTGSVNGRSGSVSMEFLAVDFLLSELANARAGLLLVPMGFLNEIHEPPFYYGVERPEPERLIIPSTWREIGAGFFGQVGDLLRYRLYLLNGLQASAFGNEGLRGARQKGNRARAEHFAVAGRLDLELRPGLQIGASFFSGKSGQNQDFDRDVNGNGTIDPGETFDLPDAWTTIWETHISLSGRGMKARGLWTQAHIDDSSRLRAALGRPVARRLIGGYAELGFDLLSWLRPGSRMTFEPFYRFEYWDTNAAVAGPRDPSREVFAHVVGLHFKPHPNLVLKADYRNLAAQAGRRADEFQLGLGFVF